MSYSHYANPIYQDNDNLFLSVGIQNLYDRFRMCQHSNLMPNKKISVMVLIRATHYYGWKICYLLWVQLCHC